MEDLRCDVGTPLSMMEGADATTLSMMEDAEEESVVDDEITMLDAKADEFTLLEPDETMVLEPDEDADEITLLEPDEPTVPEADETMVLEQDDEADEVKVLDAEPVSLSRQTSIASTDRRPEHPRLPRGWQETVDTEGRTWFCNTSTGRLQLERPWDRCGTFGCILEDRHPGMHIIEEAPRDGRACRPRRQPSTSNDRSAAEDSGGANDNAAVVATGALMKAPRAQPGGRGGRGSAVSGRGRCSDEPTSRTAAGKSSRPGLFAREGGGEPPRSQPGIVVVVAAAARDAFHA